MDKLFNKAAVITDQHFGRNSGSVVANQDNLEFLEWFIDKSLTEGAETCLCLGDWHDHRANLGVLTLDYSVRGMEMLNNAFKKVYWIPGNHDLLYRDKRDVTSIVFAKYLPNFSIVSKPMVLGDVTLLPWLVPGEKKKLKELKSRYTFGHLECSGFMLNARVPMPDHDDNPNEDDFITQERVFSGHFHLRQSRGCITYIGNIFPTTFNDSWDDERGAMILEWGKEPKFYAWPQQPLFRTMSLRQMLNEPDRMLCSKLTARVTLDLDISFEEAQVVRDEYMSRYGLRKIELIHQTKKNMEQEFSGEVSFQTVDQIVMDGLLSIQSENYKSSKLVEIYRNLHGASA